MATASSSDAALHDVLERLYAAGIELDDTGEPDAVADRAAALAMRLMRSSYAELTVGERTFSRSTEGTSRTRQNVATADMRLGGQVLGTIRVLRAAPFADYEQHALAIFASQAASALAGARLERGKTAEELAHEGAVQMLLQVSSHALSGRSLKDFYGRLARTIAELVGSDKVLFWALQEDGTLAPNAHGSFGLDRAFLARLQPTPCSPDGADLAGQVVYHDLIFRAGTKGQRGYEEVIETLGVKNAISVPWRAGDLRLGLVAAYDSVRPEGFSREDTWVLQ